MTAGFQVWTWCPEAFSYTGVYDEFLCDTTGFLGNWHLKTDVFTSVKTAYDVSFQDYYLI